MGELVMTNGVCNFIKFLKDLLKLKSCRLYCDDNGNSNEMTSFLHARVQTFFKAFRIPGKKIV